MSIDVDLMCQTASTKCVDAVDLPPPSSISLAVSRSGSKTGMLKLLNWTLMGIDGDQQVSTPRLMGAWL
jgi:hypothetical protein